MIETKAAFGWPNNLFISNGIAEAIVTLDVGPRIISYRLHDKDNVFHVEADELGRSAEPEFRLRGGHRLWIAPESHATYYPDNHPVVATIDNDLCATLTAPCEVNNNLEKSMQVTMEPGTSMLSIRHTIRATADLTEPVAAWALSVMRAGGVANVPMPPRGRHPDESEGEFASSDYLPNRHMALWTYTDLNDQRFEWHADRLLVHQSDQPATKIGFRHQLGAVSYQLEDQTFTKSVPYDLNGKYPDGGCNLEVFTNRNMLELETLSPQKLLKSGEAIVHKESWQLN